MTLEQADAVRPDDVVKKNCDVVEIEACIERETEIFGETASISAHISSRTHTVTGILVTFSRFNSPGSAACKKALVNIVGPLFDTFGSKFSKNGLFTTW